MKALSPKQNRSLFESTHFINIWCGAVRSGKSFSALIKFIDFCRNGPKGLCAIVGRSERTIRQNIIEELWRFIGNDFEYKSGKGTLSLYDREIYIVGASDARAEGRILGATYAGALVDEITLLPENVWRTLLDRLSVPKAQLFGTTNPDSPYHWLKRDFIDRMDELDLGYWEFDLEDNPSLDPVYVENLKKQNTGVWYKRRVEGKWTMAQGAVYPHFDPSRHVINDTPGLADEYYIGVDYGTSTTTAFVLLAYNPNLYPNMWVEREYYWDAKRMGRQKTNAQFAKDFVDFIGDIPIEAVFCDPAAASFKLELQNANSRLPILDAENDVTEGIRLHATLLSEGTLKICAHCKNLIAEYTSYVWDESWQKRGIDKPVKQMDHAQDALRYVLYSRFKNEVKPIRKPNAPTLFNDPMQEFFRNN